MLRVSIGLILFAVTFGYVEAAVVVYLRHIYDPLRLALFPNHPSGDLFPLIPFDQLSPALLKLLAVELGREAATLLMLLGAGLLATRERGHWIAGFAITFGFWDLSFYLFLKVLLDWPASLLTWDLLFLIPVPWVGPVLAPVIVSVVLIVCGFIVLVHEWRGHPIRATLFHWIGLIGGAGVIIASFTLNYRTLIAGALPEQFNWMLFLTGMLMGLGSFAHAWLKRP